MCSIGIVFFFLFLCLSFFFFFFLFLFLSFSFFFFFLLSLLHFFFFDFLKTNKQIPNWHAGAGCWAMAPRSAAWFQPTAVLVGGSRPAAPGPCPRGRAHKRPGAGLQPRPPHWPGRGPACGRLACTQSTCGGPAAGRACTHRTPPAHRHGGDAAVAAS